MTKIVSAHPSDSLTSLLHPLLATPIFTPGHHSVDLAIWEIDEVKLDNLIAIILFFYLFI